MHERTNIQLSAIDRSALEAGVANRLAGTVPGRGRGGALARDKTRTSRIPTAEPCSGRTGCRHDLGGRLSGEFFPDAAWQRCIVHWYRNIFSHVPSTKVREIAAMLKAIHAGEDIVAAREKAVRVIEKLPTQILGEAQTSTSCNANLL